MANKSKKTNNPITDFERLTRIIRWIAIFATLIILPNNADVRMYLSILILAAVIFNIARYSKPLMRISLFASPYTVMALDSFFIAVMAVVVGPITPYSFYIIFILISATYITGVKGIVVISSSALVYLLLLTAFPISGHIVLDNYQTLLVGGLITIIVCIQIEQLTHTDRIERDELKRLNNSNKIEHSRIITLLNSINDAVFVVDSSGTIIQHNTMATVISSMGDDMTDMKFIDVFPLYETGQSKSLDILKNVSSEYHNDDLYTVTKKDTRYNINLYINPIKNTGDKTTSYIVIAQDITKEHSLDDQRKEFISVISHELRTPLTILEATISTALSAKSDISPKVTKLLEQSHRKVMYLSDTIKNLTLISRAGNKSPITLSHVNSRKLLEQIRKDFIDQAKQKDINIHTFTDEKILPILTEKTYVTEILQNYMTNALKYSDSGVIKVQAKRNKNGGIVFSVQDNGIGISPQDQKNLFIKFFRAEDYRTQETEGSGFGLYLCKELAERIGGTVWAKSDPDKGSTFYLEIPPAESLKKHQSEVTSAHVSSLMNDL